MLGTNLVRLTDVWIMLTSLAGGLQSLLERFVLYLRTGTMALHVVFAFPESSRIEFTSMTRSARTTCRSGG